MCQITLRQYHRGCHYINCVRPFPYLHLSPCSWYEPTSHACDRNQVTVLDVFNFDKMKHMEEEDIKT